MANRIQLRRDTAANWTTANPVLASGEKGYETDTKRQKIGDGTTAWSSLGYLIDKGTADASYAFNTAQGLEVLRTQVGNALRPFRATLGARVTTPVDVVVIGDSISEGQASSTLSNRWITQFVSNLRKSFQPSGVGGSLGYMPSWHALTSPTGTSPTVAGTPTQSSNSGLGRRVLQLNASGDSVTFVVTCTSFDLLYTTQTSTVSTFTVTIDGGAPTTVTPASGGIISAKWNSGALSAAAHTIVVAWASNTPQIEGLMPYYQDETKGIRLWDAAHYGFTTSSYTSLGYWATSLSMIPNCGIAVIYLGTNDFGTNVASATFQTNLTSIIATVRGKLAATTILVVAGYERSGSFAEPWSNYVAAMYAAAATDSFCAVVDLSKRMVKCSAETISGVYNADGVHPADKGHLMIADAVTAYVTAP
jgi:lysophospholipase L1-like esterase